MAYCDNSRLLVTARPLPAPERYIRRPSRCLVYCLDAMVSVAILDVIRYDEARGPDVKLVGEDRDSELRPPDLNRATTLVHPSASYDFIVSLRALYTRTPTSALANGHLRPGRRWGQ